MAAGICDHVDIPGDRTDSNDVPESQRRLDDHVSRGNKGR